VGSLFKRMLIAAAVKRMLIAAAALAMLILIGLSLHAEPPSATDAPVPKIIEPLIDGFYPTYPATSPATGAQQDLIQRGEYLAKMGDCIACHTNVKGGTGAFAGGLPLETPFGTFYSPNITPDKETEPQYYSG